MTKYSPENPEGNPWTFLSKREFIDNQWVNVSQHQVLNVAGNETTYNVVSFKNRAVGIVPLHEDGRITLVGQFRYTLNQYSWELPEGGCPENENMLDCAHRELEEETGLKAEIVEPFFKIHTSNSVTDEWGMVYLAKGLSQGQAAPEENEVLQTRKVTIEELLDEVEAAKVTDSITIAAAYKLAWLKAIDQI